MNFTAPLFYAALVLAVAVFYWLPGRWRAIYLLALSYAFYALSSRIYLVLLIVASAGAYAAGLAIAKSGGERAKHAVSGGGGRRNRCDDRRLQGGGRLARAAIAARRLLLLVQTDLLPHRSLLGRRGGRARSGDILSVSGLLSADRQRPHSKAGAVLRPDARRHGQDARRRPARSGTSADIGRTDDEAPGRRPPGGLHHAHRQVARRLFLLGHARHHRLLSVAALCGFRRLHEHRAWNRQAVRRRWPAQLPCAVRRGQPPGILAPLAYEPDELGDGLSVHAAVDVAARTGPSRARPLLHAEHGHHRPVAWVHSGFFRFRRPAGRSRLRHRAHRHEPQAPRAQTRSRARARAGRRRWPA